jgi:hypothetical protein
MLSSPCNQTVTSSIIKRTGSVLIKPVVTCKVSYNSKTVCPSLFAAFSNIIIHLKLPFLFNIADIIEVGTDYSREISVKN